MGGVNKKKGSNKTKKDGKGPKQPKEPKKTGVPREDDIIPLPQDRINAVRPFWEGLSAQQRAELLTLDVEELRERAVLYTERFERQAALEISEAELRGEELVPLASEFTLSQSLEEGVSRLRNGRSTWKVWEWPDEDGEGTETFYDGESFRTYLLTQLDKEKRELLPREEPGVKSLEKPAEAALRTRMSELLNTIQAHNRQVQEEANPPKRSRLRRGDAEAIMTRDPNAELVTIMLAALEKEHEYIYNAVQSPVTRFVCDVLAEGNRESTCTELCFEDLDRLPTEEVARICEWITEKVDSFASKLKPEAKDADVQDEEEAIGDVDLFQLETKPTERLAVHSNWLGHLAERQLGENGHPRKVGPDEDPAGMGLVLEWVYGSIVSTAEKARDGAKRTLRFGAASGRGAMARAALDALVSALEEQVNWTQRASQAKELLSSMLASRRNAKKLSLEHDIRPQPPLLPDGETASVLPDSCIMAMLEREALLTRAKLHGIVYEQLVDDRKLRSLKTQLRQGEPEFDRLKRELEDVKNAPRGLEGTFRSAAEMERHRAAAADAAIEEQLEVQTSFRQHGARLQGIYDKRQRTEISMAKREQELKQLQGWRATVQSLLERFQDLNAQTTTAAEAVAAANSNCNGDSADMERGGGGEALSSGNVSRTVVGQQDTALQKMRQHFQRDVRRQLYTEEDDCTFFQWIQTERKAVEVRLAEGAAALQHLEMSFVNTACDDPGSVIGSQLALPMLQERLDEQALMFATRRAADAEAAIVRMDEETRERDMAAREKKAQAKSKVKGKARTEKERAAAEKLASEAALEAARRQLEADETKAAEIERAKRADAAREAREEEDRIMEARRSELMKDEGSHWSKRMVAAAAASAQLAATQAVLTESRASETAGDANRSKVTNFSLANGNASEEELKPAREFTKGLNNGKNAGNSKRGSDGGQRQIPGEKEAGAGNRRRSGQNATVFFHLATGGEQRLDASDAMQHSSGRSSPLPNSRIPKRGSEPSQKHEEHRALPSPGDRNSTLPLQRHSDPRKKANGVVKVDTPVVVITRGPSPVMLPPPGSVPQRLDTLSVKTIQNSQQRRSEPFSAPSTVLVVPPPPTLPAGSQLACLPPIQPRPQLPAPCLGVSEPRRRGSHDIAKANGLPATETTTPQHQQRQQGPKPTWEHTAKAEGQLLSIGIAGPDLRLQQQQAGGQQRVGISPHPIREHTQQADSSLPVHSMPSAQSQGSGGTLSPDGSALHRQPGSFIPRQQQQQQQQQYNLNKSHPLQQVHQPVAHRMVLPNKGALPSGRQPGAVPDNPAAVYGGKIHAGPQGGRLHSIAPGVHPPLTPDSSLSAHHLEPQGPLPHPVTMQYDAMPYSHHREVLPSTITQPAPLPREQRMRERHPRLLQQVDGRGPVYSSGVLQEPPHALQTEERPIAPVHNHHNNQQQQQGQQQGNVIHPQLLIRQRQQQSAREQSQQVPLQASEYVGRDRPLTDRLLADRPLLDRPLATSSSQQPHSLLQSKAQEGGVELVGEPVQPGTPPLPEGGTPGSSYSAGPGSSFQWDTANGATGAMASAPIAPGTPTRGSAMRATAQPFTLRIGAPAFVPSLLSAAAAAPSTDVQAAKNSAICSDRAPAPPQSGPSSSHVESGQPQYSSTTRPLEESGPKQTSNNGVPGIPQSDASCAASIERQWSGSETSTLSHFSTQRPPYFGGANLGQPYGQPFSQPYSLPYQSQGQQRESDQVLLVSASQQQELMQLQQQGPDQTEDAQQRAHIQPSMRSSLSQEQDAHQQQAGGWQQQQGAQSEAHSQGQNRLSVPCGKWEVAASVKYSSSIQEQQVQQRIGGQQSSGHLVQHGDSALELHSLDALEGDTQVRHTSSQPVLGAAVSEVGSLTAPNFVNAAAASGTAASVQPPAQLPTAPPRWSTIAARSTSAQQQQTSGAHPRGDTSSARQGALCNNTSPSGTAAVATPAVARILTHSTAGSDRGSTSSLTGQPRRTAAQRMSGESTCSVNGGSPNGDGVSAQRNGAASRADLVVNTQRLRLVRGLTSESGENNCFLNVIIQSLWHLPCFRKAVLQGRRLSQDAPLEDRRVSEALTNIFRAFDTQPNEPLAAAAAARSTESDAGANESPSSPTTAVHSGGSWAVSPAELRDALGGLCDGSFNLSDMHDAAEVFGQMFACLHRAEAGVTEDTWDSQLPRRVPAGKQISGHSAGQLSGASLSNGTSGGPTDAARSASMVQLLFGLEVQAPCPVDYQEKGAASSQPPHTAQLDKVGSASIATTSSSKSNGKRADQGQAKVIWSTTHMLQYFKFYHLLPASGLRVAYDTLLDGSFEDLVRAADASEMVTSRATGGAVSDGDGRAPGLSLLNVPCIFTLALIWESHQAPLDAISSTIAALQTEMNVRAVFGEASPKQQQHTTIHHLRCVVAYSGHHYQAYAINQEVNRWLLFDDTNIRMIGSWSDVKTSLRTARHQPCLLFYDSTPL